MIKKTSNCVYFIKIILWACVHVTYPAIIINYTINSDNYFKKNITIRTRVPDILYPNVSAGGEKQPLHRDEQQAYDVWRERNANKKHRECLKDKKKKRKGNGGKVNGHVIILGHRMPLVGFSLKKKKKRQFWVCKQTLV